jgi:YfiH family protein
VTPASWLAPSWRIQGVGAFMTTRTGGTSAGRFASMNVGDRVGDDPASVAANRRLLAAATGASPVYLRQVHGERVVRVGAHDAADGAPLHEADASVAVEPGIACVVQAADCLPVLLAARNGRAVGAAHAGWRGLAAGVVDAAAAAVAGAAACSPQEIVAWLGACIGPRSFEVGADVLAAFGVAPGADAADRFRPLREGKWLANLPLLARERLAAAGIAEIESVDACTVEDASRFFSFRRDGVTGRMAAAIWIEPGRR